MSDHRAKNLTAGEQADQMANALHCVLEAAASAARQARRPHDAGRRLAPSRRSLRRAAPVTVVLVSSSPELRAQLHAQLQANRKRRGRGADAAGGLDVVVFDWRRYLAQASPSAVRALSSSETAATAFCARVAASEAHRCDRAAHLRDWGPEPHWVAAVELLLLASATDAVIGAGFPYFKVQQLAYEYTQCTPTHRAPFPSLHC